MQRRCRETRSNESDPRAQLRSSGGGIGTELSALPKQWDQAPEAALRANNDETSTRREFSLEGVEESSRGHAQTGYAVIGSEQPRN